MMRTEEILKVFLECRGDAIVVPGRGGRYWVGMSTRPERDATMMGTPAMGGHASFALGLALARPEEKVVLFDSDGDLLMGLGVLATVAEKSPKNFYHFMLDNDCYATTGGQPVPNAKNIRYDLLAQGAGYPSTHVFEELEDFSSKLESILGRPGPVFVRLKVEPEIVNLPVGMRRRWQTKPREQVIADLRDELGPRVSGAALG